MNGLDYLDVQSFIKGKRITIPDVVPPNRGTPYKVTGRVVVSEITTNHLAVILSDVIYSDNPACPQGTRFYTIPLDNGGFTVEQELIIKA